MSIERQDRQTLRRIGMGGLEPQLFGVPVRGGLIVADAKNHRVYPIEEWPLSHSSLTSNRWSSVIHGGPSWLGSTATGSLPNFTTRLRAPRGGCSTALPLGQRVAQLSRRLVGREGALDPQLVQGHVPGCAERGDRGKEAEGPVVLAELDGQQRGWGLTGVSRSPPRRHAGKR